MITAIGRFTVRRHRLILILALLFVVASGAIGGSVVAKLSGGGLGSEGCLDASGRDAQRPVQGRAAQLRGAGEGQRRG
jgi:hypothetical protein